MEKQKLQLEDFTENEFWNTRTEISKSSSKRRAKRARLLS